MSILSIIFAMNANRIIGHKNGLPWSLPSDLQRFRNITSGKPVIMGRKTFESILARNGKPLPDRCNVVITRNATAWRRTRLEDLGRFRTCIFVSSLCEGISLMEPAPEIFIIGGAEIYKQALPFADRMYFTQISGDFAGDITFPLFNMNNWEMQREELVHTDNHPYVFSVLQRKPHTKTEQSRITGDNLVNPKFALRDGYCATIADIHAQKSCPFCPENFLWHPWPILQRYNGWFITRNGWPYENAEHHFLIIGERHIISTLQMTPGDNEAVHALSHWAIKQFGLTGYGLLSRSGDTNHTGSTVQHLHFHLIQPKIGADGKAQTVLFPIG